MVAIIFLNSLTAAIIFRLFNFNCIAYWYDVTVAVDLDPH